jgi:hypothetical protein
MKKAVVTLAIVLSLSLPVLAQAPKQNAPAKAPAATAAVEAKIRQEWQDFKAKNKTGLGAALADDTTQIWADNKPARDKATALKDMDAFTIDTFTLSNVKVTPLGAGAALATYQAKVVGAMGGQKMDVTLAVTEVWVKRGSDWKDLRYHESEIK